MLTATFASRNSEKILVIRNISSMTYIIEDSSRQLVTYIHLIKTFFFFFLFSELNFQHTWVNQFTQWYVWSPLYDISPDIFEMRDV